MATKQELEEELKVKKKKEKEVEAMISLWAVELEAVQRSPDHPFSIINKVISSMKNHLGIA